MSSQTLLIWQQRLTNFTELTGRLVAWLTLALVIGMFVVAILRFAFNISLIWAQELIEYIHVYIFMLGMAYTLKHEEHVRVDIFYRGFRERTRYLVNLLGTLILLVPVRIYIFAVSWDDVIRSWTALEPSQDTGGLPANFILKSTMLLMPALLLLQGIANCFLYISRLRNPNENYEEGC